MNNIISIVIILTSIGVFFGYIDPEYSKVKVLLEEKDQYYTAIKNSNELQGVKKALIEKSEAIDAGNREALFKLLPDNIDNIRLIIDIDEMAKTHQMTIRNFKTDTAEEKDTLGRDGNPYGTLTLSFSTAAPYDRFLAFIADLERSLRIIDIASIDFSVTEGNPIYDYDVKIKTYWLK